MTETNPSFVYDAITTLLDEVAQIPDPVVRLAALQYALTLTRRLSVQRNEAAHESRLVNSAGTVVRRTGFAADSIRMWSRLHAERTGDTRTVRATTRDLSRAVHLDLRPIIPQ